MAENSMQAVILAGGLGTRMRPITETIPKPMIALAGKPFLQHQLELLSGAGCERALLNAEAQLQDYFVLVNGDTYLGIDYRALVKEFAGANCSALIVAYEKPAAISQGIPASLLPNNLGVHADGVVTAYRKRDPEGLSHIDAGVIVLKKEIFAGLRPRQKCSLEEEIYPSLIARGEMRAWVTREPFYDMGSPQGLAALEEKLK